MYFCIHCKQLHTIQAYDHVFRTGFRQDLTGERYPLGVCTASLSAEFPNPLPTACLPEAHHLAERRQS